jgi:integrase
MSRPRIEKFQVKHSVSGNGPCHWCVILRRPGGKKIRYWFRTKEKAEAKCRERNLELSAMGTDAMTLSASLADTARKGEGKLQSFGWSLQQAVDFTVDHLTRLSQSISVALMGEKVRAEFARQFEKGEISKGHAKNVKQSLNGLIREFGERNVCEITCNQLRMDVGEEDWTIHTKNNRLKDWHLAFETAKDMEIVPVNPVAGLKGFKDTAAKKDIVILTPEEVTALLKAADPLVLPSLLIGAFAGCRRSERLQMDWSMIDLTLPGSTASAPGKARIKIPASISKTRRERRIEMMPNLVEWLRPLVKDGKLIEVNEDKHDKLVRDAKVATGLVNGEDDFQNALRHSFVTYFYCFTGSLERSLDAAGHDFKTHKKNYRSDKVEKEEAVKYWEIKP